MKFAYIVSFPNNVYFSNKMNGIIKNVQITKLELK